MLPQQYRRVCVILSREGKSPLWRDNCLHLKTLEIGYAATMALPTHQMIIVIYGWSRLVVWKKEKRKDRRQKLDIH